MANMKLIHEKTDMLVKVGDKIESFRGEPHIVANLEGAPFHPGSTGRVYVRPIGSNLIQGYYPGVFDLKWVEEV